MDRAADGQKIVAGLVRIEVWAVPMSRPQLSADGGRPIPRNDSVASATMNVPRDTVATTMTGASEFGMTWRTSVLKRLTPRAAEAMT